MLQWGKDVQTQILLGSNNGPKPPVVHNWHFVLIGDYHQD